MASSSSSAGRSALGLCTPAKKPSLSVYLSASTQAPAAVGTPNNRVVKSILHDLDRIKRSKPRRRLQKCEKLVYYIVQQLRALRHRAGADDDSSPLDDILQPVTTASAAASNTKKPQPAQQQHDHLLETTTIWALTHILRIDSQHTREIMLGAGVPGLLFDIMSSHTLTGATRQYASELCYYLCSKDEVFPDGSSEFQTMGPLPLSFPQGSYMQRSFTGANGGRGGGGYTVGDDASFAGSELSSLADDRGTLPFVPYRLSEDNMRRLDALFTDADKDIRTERDINVNVTAKGGRSRTAQSSMRSGNSKHARTELHGTTFPHERSTTSHHSILGMGIGIGRMDLLEELDDRSVSSSISSQSASRDSLAEKMGVYDSTSQRTLRGGPWQSHSTLEHTLGQEDSMWSEISRDRFESSNAGGNNQRKSKKLFHVRATPALQPAPRLNGKPAKSTTRGFLDKIVRQSNAHFALDSRLGEAYNPNESLNSLGSERRDVRDVIRDGQFGGGIVRGTDSIGPPSPTSSLLLLSPRQPSPRGGGGEDEVSLSQTPRRRVKLASLDKDYDMGPASRLLSPQEGRVGQGWVLSAGPGQKRKAGASSSSSSIGYQPGLSLDLSEQNSHVTFSRSRLSVTSGVDPPDVPGFLASLDPLSLEVTRGLAAHILDGGQSMTGSSMASSKQAKRDKLRRENKLALETNDDDRTVYSRSSSDGSDDDDDADIDAMIMGGLLGPGQTADQWKAENAHLQQTDPEYYNTALGAIERAKQIKAKKKVRIRAEKLMDHTFTRQLFSKKATLADTQLLVRRLQDVLELVDSDRSGYVTWDSFARCVLAVAPQKLLRADVQAFLDAQSDDPQALLDYREFVISGKLIVLQKQNGRAILPINGWLERQKLYTGDVSTLSWKNHVEWYNARQSAAVIWLMRRAARSFTRNEYYMKVWQELRNIGRRALAFDYLRSLSGQATTAGTQREAAKRFILQRCHHARLLIIRREEAQRYLSALAYKVVELEAIKFAAEERLRAEDVFVERTVQASYSKLWLVHFRQISTREKLFWYGQRALRHTERTSKDVKWLIDYAKMVMIQLLLREDAQGWLLRCAQRYVDYCTLKDTVVLSLMRDGRRALAYLNRQITAFDWLFAKGKAVVLHVARQDRTGQGLCTQGQRVLAFLNAREDALLHCLNRRRNADILIARQKESIAFFRALVGRVWANAAAIAKAQMWLEEKAAAAIIFQRRRDNAYLRLVYVAGRAHVVRRRVVTTFIDLQQIGQFARITNFNRYWTGVKENLARVKEEVTRQIGFDKKHTLEHEAESSLPLDGTGSSTGTTKLGGMDIRERWHLELEDAFNCISKALLLPGESVNDKTSLADSERTPLLTRVGFTRLMLQGRLLGLLPADINNAWQEVDPRATGYTTFEDLWSHWFENAAVSYHKKLIQARKRGPPGAVGFGNEKFGLFFCLSDIVPPLERVLMVFKKRFAAQETKLALRAAAGEDGSDSDEERKEDEDDDDDSGEEDDEESQDLQRPMSSQEGRSNRTEEEQEYDRVFSMMLGQEEGVMDPYEDVEFSYEQRVEALRVQKILEREREAEEARQREIDEQLRQQREERALMIAAGLLETEE